MVMFGIVTEKVCVPLLNVWALTAWLKTSAPPLNSAAVEFLPVKLDVSAPYLERLRHHRVHEGALRAAR